MTPQQSTEVATIQRPVQAEPEQIQIFNYHQRLAKLFAQSGLFQDIKGVSPEQSIAAAYVKIALGDSMGFSPAEAMQGIDIIKGRVSVGANLRASRMQRAGFKWDIIKLDENGCKLIVYGPTGSKLGEASFTREDADRAGLMAKDNYRMHPSDMFFARAITRAQRRYAPGVLSLDILSTEEAIELPRLQEPMRASISMEQVKASAEPNRGHDATNGEKQKPGELTSVAEVVSGMSKEQPDSVDPDIGNMFGPELTYQDPPGEQPQKRKK